MSPGPPSVWHICPSDSAVPLSAPGLYVRCISATMDGTALKCTLCFMNASCAVYNTYIKRWVLCGCRSGVTTHLSCLFHRGLEKRVRKLKEGEYRQYLFIFGHSLFNFVTSTIRKPTTTTTTGAG